MNKLVSLLLAGLFVCGSGVARDVTSFNTGWQFKKGPFSADAMKAASQWEGKWETVDIPHTWNARDMQVRYNNFYEGVGYYKKNFFCPGDLKDKYNPQNEAFAIPKRSVPIFGPLSKTKCLIFYKIRTAFRWTSNPI